MTTLGDDNGYLQRKQYSLSRLLGGWYVTPCGSNLSLRNLAWVLLGGEDSDTKAVTGQSWSSAPCEASLCARTNKSLRSLRCISRFFGIPVSLLNDIISFDF